MKLRLKDPNLQAQLDAMDPPSGFTEALSKFDPEKLVEGNFIWFPVRFGKGNRYVNNLFRVDITKNDVECVESYNPHFWNAFPEVTPPEGVWMRIEYAFTDFGEKARFIDGEWWDGRNDEAGFEGKIIRFRPWDEDSFRDEDEGPILD